MRKSKLVVDPLFDFDLIGIISHGKGYRIAWEISQILGVSMTKANDQLIRFNDGSLITVVNYSHTTENGGLYLLKNRGLENKESGQMMLVPELQQFDYLLKIIGADSFDPEEVMSKLKKIQIIQFCSFIDPEDLKSKENLVFDYE